MTLSFWIFGREVLALHLERPEPAAAEVEAPAVHAIGFSAIDLRGDE